MLRRHDEFAALGLQSCRDTRRGKAENLAPFPFMAGIESGNLLIFKGAVRNSIEQDFDRWQRPALLGRRADDKQVISVEFRGGQLTKRRFFYYCVYCSADSPGNQFRLAILRIINNECSNLNRSCFTFPLGSLTFINFTPNA